jgi:hypothetical protein
VYVQTVALIAQHYAFADAAQTLTGVGSPIMIATAAMKLTTFVLSKLFAEENEDD